MAARINTRFVILLLTICGAVAIVAGAVGYYALRKDPTRNIRRGDELLAEGRFADASVEYGRAVDKEPSNLEFLQKFEDALLQVRPETRVHADGFYRQRLAVLNQRATVRPTDPKYHLEFIEEMYTNARLTNDVSWWNELARFAETALTRVPEGTQGRDEIRLYKLIADAERLPTLTPEDADRNLADLRQYVVQYPENGRAWATLILRLLRDAERDRMSGKTDIAQSIFLEVDDVLADAVDRLPDDPHIAMVRARTLGAKASRQPGSVAPEELRAENERLVQIIGQLDNELLMTEAASILPMLGGAEGLRQGSQLLSDYLTDHPEALLPRWILCDFQFDLRNLDESNLEAERILNSEPLPVSFMATFRFDLRRQAAKRIFDVEFQRASALQDDAFKAQIEKAREARDRLASLFPEPQKEPAVIECDAWLALSDQNFSVAASKFSEVIERQAASLPTLSGAAKAFESVGELGAAYEAIETALSVAPNHVGLLEHAIRLEMQLGQRVAAADHARQILEIDPDHATAQLYLNQLEGVVEQAGAASPTEALFQGVDELLREGDIQGARAMLLEAYEANQQNYPIVAALTQIEVQNGMREQAAARLEGLIEQFPREERLRSLLASARNDDPVASLREMVQWRFSDEGDRAVAMAINLRRMEENQRAFATRSRSAGRVEQARAAEELAERYAGEASTALQQAQRLAPHHSDLLEMRFQDALISGDQKAAEEIAALAREHNADLADGMTFDARLQLQKENTEAAVVSLLEASERKPYAANIWRLLGVAYAKLGNVPDALQSYQKALERRPNDPATIKLYAQLLLETGDRVQALDLLRSLGAVAQNDPEIRELWLLVEAEVGDPYRAIQFRRDRRQTTPEDRTNALRLAALLGRVGPDRRHVTDARGNIRFSETSWSTMSAAQREGLIGPLREEWRREGEAIFAELLRDGADDLELVAARAGFYRDTGRAAEGRRILEEYVTGHEANAIDGSMFLVLAQFNTSIGDHQGALAALQRGLAHQSDERREIDIALGSIYFERGAFAEAKKHLEDAADKIDDRSLQLQIVECAIKLDEFENAENRLSAIEREGGTTSTMELLRADLEGRRGAKASGEGRTADAERAFQRERAAIERAIQLAPSQPLPYLKKAESTYARYRRNGNSPSTLLDEALAQLNSATEKQALYPPAIRLRSQILMAKSPPDIRGALSELTTLLASSPRDEITRRMAVQLCLMMGDLTRARTLVEEGVQLAPNRAEWLSIYAEVLENSGLYLEAGEQYQLAFEQRRDPVLLRSWARVMLLADPPATRQVVATLKAAESAFNSDPIMQCLYAKALALDGQFEEAKTQLRSAHAKYRAAAQQQNRPGLLGGWVEQSADVFGDRPIAELEEFVRSVSGEPLKMSELYALAKAWAATGREGGSRAIELLDQALESIPDGDKAAEAEVLLAVAQTYYVLQEYEKAAENYRKVLALVPNHVMALNDLAYTYADRLSRPEEALPYAEQAAALYPNDWNILDTVGTVYLKLNRLDDAERALGRSMQISTSASNLFHMAEVYLGKGERQRARDYLRRAADANPNPELREQIEELQRQIGN